MCGDVHPKTGVRDPRLLLFGLSVIHLYCHTGTAHFPNKFLFVIRQYSMWRTRDPQIIRARGGRRDSGSRQGSPAHPAGSILSDTGARPVTPKQQRGLPDSFFHIPPLSESVNRLRAEDICARVISDARSSVKK